MASSKGEGCRAIHPSEFLVSSDVRLSSSLTFCNDVWFLSYEIEHFEFPEQELIPMCRDCRVIIFRFDGNTQWQMILLLNGRHVGISPKGTNMESPHKIWLKHFSENAGMNDRTDLNRGKVVYISIIFYISTSWFNLLNGLRFLFLIAWHCNPTKGELPRGLKSCPCLDKITLKILPCVG